MDTGDLGIEYGECYVLALSDGQQIGRVRENGEYRIPGFFSDLPFMVCDKDRECKKTGPVRFKDPFTLYDVVGRENSDATKYSQRGFISRGLGHEKITNTVDNFAIFEGTPSCLDGDYAICLGGHGPGNVGVGLACPAEAYKQAFSTNYLNPNLCMRLVFKQITCPSQFAVPFVDVATDRPEDLLYEQVDL